MNFSRDDIRDNRKFEQMMRAIGADDTTEADIRTVSDGYADGEYSDPEEEAKADLIYKAQRAVDAVRLHEESIRVLSKERRQIARLVVVSWAITAVLMVLLWMRR